MKRSGYKRLLVCGPIGSILFMSTVGIQGLLRENYSSLRFPLSSLAIGPSGWVQQANFMLTGLLIMACAVGLRRVGWTQRPARWPARLIALAGLGLVGAGCFVTDPVYGYPATAPLALAQFTVRGHLHDFFSMFVFIGLPAACFTSRKPFKAAGQAGWATYSFWSGVGFLSAFLLGGIGFKQVPGLVDVAGLLQRTCLLIGFTWISLVAIYFTYHLGTSSSSFDGSLGKRAWGSR